MKRNMDLVRTILIAIENSVDDEPGTIHLPHKDFDDVTIYQHVRMMHEGNLIHAVEGHGFDNSAPWYPHSLTWHGHDFLDAVRDEGIWARVRLRETESGHTLPLEALFRLALHEINEKLKLLPPNQSLAAG